MKTGKNFWLWSMVILMSLSRLSSGYAQDNQSENLVEKFTGTFDGYLKNETAVRLDEPDRFVKIENSVELGYSKRLNEHIGITLKGLALYDAVYDVEDDLDVEDEEDYRAYIELREGFADLTFGKVDFRLGKQQVVWGKTDGFRVIDVVNPLDYREFILNDFIDSRIPLWIAKMDYYFTSEYSLQLLVIPEMQFAESAHSGSEYAFRLPEIPQGIMPVINPIDEPDESFENTEYGVKFSGFYRGWDFTVNYLYGWDDEPIIKQSLDLTTGTLTVSPEHERLNILGGTFANVFWDTVIRGEFAAKFGKYFSLDDQTDPDMATKKTLLNYALAFERDLLDMTWTLQFLQETVVDYNSAMRDDQTSTNITLRGSKEFMNETLEVTLFTIYGVNESEFLIRPAVEYDITDSTKIKVGLDLFEGGDEETFLGQFDDKDRVYAELKYSF